MSVEALTNRNKIIMFAIFLNFKTFVESKICYIKVGARTIAGVSLVAVELKYFRLPPPPSRQLNTVSNRIDTGS